VRFFYYPTIKIGQKARGCEAPLSGARLAFSLRGWLAAASAPRLKPGVCACAGAQPRSCKVRLGRSLSLKKQIAASFPCLEGLVLDP